MVASYRLRRFISDATSLSIPTCSRYHQAGSAQECVKLVEEVAGDMSRLHLLQQESISLHRQFYSHYGERIVGQLIETSDSIREAKANTHAPVR